MPLRACKLLKLGEREFMSRLLCKGEVYMSPLGRFTTLDVPERGDCDEGLLAKARKGDGVTIDMTLEFDGQDIDLGTVEPNDLTLHIDSGHGIYCMCGLSSDTPTDEDLSPALCHLEGKQRIWLPPKLKAFGSYGVLILNNPEFVRRLEKAATATGLTLTHGFVEYAPRKPPTLMGPFRKYDEFKHQAEVRFLTNEKLDGPMSLMLGNLRDIAVMHDFSSSWHVFENPEYC
jgi:hypothetical protein